MSLHNEEGRGRDVMRCCDEEERGRDVMRCCDEEERGRHVMRCCRTSSRLLAPRLVSSNDASRKDLVSFTTQK